MTAKWSRSTTAKAGIRSNGWFLYKKRVYNDFEGWEDSVKIILSLMKKTDIWALFKHPPCESYIKSRVCLLGDAEHTSTPRMALVQA